MCGFDARITIDNVSVETEYTKRVYAKYCMSYDLTTILKQKLVVQTKRCGF